ncbi:Eukaryotic/viral aspartic protease [Phytophthora megakarya]|uniref:Eukaryotic/viral aspartic protease n=1 Tax=Phytophthora megakarya TaxID=4795 RepID=A0A225W165_9STRA|nr:Eukaryotic/viral aspartic protease [Phytophthora megakarya]
MVPRPRSTPEDGVEIKQESVAGAPSIGRSSVVSELEEDRHVASWSSDGTFTTGHGTSADHEDYEEPFAVPDVAPPGATTDFDASRGPTSLKHERVEDPQPVPTRAKPAKRKPKKKKKMRAPESEDKPTPKTASKDAGRQYTAEDFIKPKLIGELTGPFHELNFSAPTSTTPTTGRKAGTRVVPPPPSYASSEDSDSSIEYPERMPTRRLPRVMQLAATLAEPETPSTEGPIPKVLEDAIVRLIQSTRMQTAPETTPSAPLYASPTPASRPATTDTVPQESTDVTIESVSSRSSSRSKRHQDENPDNLFDLDAGITGTVSTVSTATAGAGVARVRLSAFSELKEFNGKDASEEKARAWFNRLKPAAKICYSDGTSEEKREHVEQFIGTLGAQEQELTSRLTLMEVPDTATLEKKLRARRRGLARQKKTLFGSNRFRQKAPTPTPTPARPVHAVQIATDDYDSGCEETLTTTRSVTKIRTTKNGQRYRCLRVCKACGDVHEAGKCSLEEFFNQLRQWYDPRKHGGMLPPTAEKMLNYVARWNGNQYETSDLCSEMSILDTTFAREVGCQIDTSVTQESVGIRDETYFTVGKTRVKVTLAGNVVYYMDPWVGDLVGQYAIFGMNFIVPARVRIDTADGTACLPDEIRIRMIGRRLLYRSQMRPMTISSLIRVAVGQTYDVLLRPEMNVPRLWMTRGATWWTPTDAVPRAFGFVQPESRKYDDWQNLAYRATSDVDDEAIFGETSGPMIELRKYVDPQATMGRSEMPGNQRGEHQGRKVAAISTVLREDNTESTDAAKTRDAPSLKLEHGPRLGTDPDPGPRLGTEPEHGPRGDVEPEHGPHFRMGSTEEPDPSFEEIPEYEHADEEVIFHEGSDLFAEDVEAEMAVLPEVPLMAEIVWNKRKWLIGKGNALPPAVKGVICDIDVGNARPVAQRVRKISSQFREKLADLIRGPLSARMIRASKSPWASPIVVIVKKNGVDIRLCVDYWLVNGLTQLMVYPMPLVTAFLDDLDKYRWYCS